MSGWLRRAGLGAILAASVAAATPADAQLKYVGFSGACDEQYQQETLPFTNICTVGLDDPRLTDRAWVADMIKRDVGIVLTLGDTFFEPTGTGTYRLRSDYRNRWKSEIAGKEWAIGGLAKYLYLADEPNVLGVTSQNIETVHDLVKEDFPRIATATSLADVNVAGWLGSGTFPTDVAAYHRYCVRDPRTDAQYQQDLAIIGAHSAGKKRVVVPDAFYDPACHGANGIGAEEMGDVYRNYYAMASVDPDVEALIGFHWSDLAGPSIGARDLPEDAQAAYRSIGSFISGKCAFPPQLTAIDPSVRPHNAMFFEGCRFVATMHYRIPWMGNQTGLATAIPFSDTANNYWFFTPDNLEGALKVLDFRSIGGAWGVYLTNNSDLPVDVRIYDLYRGTLAWAYFHDGGALAVVSGFDD